MTTTDDTPVASAPPAEDWFDRLYAEIDLAEAAEAEVEAEAEFAGRAERDEKRRKKRNGASGKSGDERRKKRRKKNHKGGKGKTTLPTPSSRWGWLAYNGAAAAIGHGLVWGVTGEPLAGAELLGAATVSLVPLGVALVTGGAAYAGWKAGGFLKGLPGPAGLAARPAGALGGGLWGQGTGPLLTDGIAALSPWPQFLAPLLIAGAVGAGCWWLLERRVVGWRPATRFAARIPLATVVLSSALYAPGVVL